MPTLDPERYPPRPAGPAGEGGTLGGMLNWCRGGPTADCGVAAWHETHQLRPESLPAVIWCRYCAQPADGDDEFCTPHREGVPSAVTDPWLVRQYLQQLRRRGSIVAGPHCEACTAIVYRFGGEAYRTMVGAVAARNDRRRR